MALGFNQYDSDGSVIFSADQQLISFKYSLGIQYITAAQAEQQTGVALATTTFCYPEESLVYRKLIPFNLKFNNQVFPFKKAYGKSSSLYPNFTDTSWYCCPNEAMYPGTTIECPKILGIGSTSTSNARVVVTSTETTALPTSIKYFELYDSTQTPIYNLSNYSRHSNLQYMFTVPANTCTTANVGTFPSKVGSGQTIRYIKRIQVTSKDGFPLYVPGVNHSAGVDRESEFQPVDRTKAGAVFKWNSTGTVLDITYFIKYPSSFSITSHYYFVNKMNEMDVNIPIMSFPTVNKDYYTVV